VLGREIVSINEGIKTAGRYSLIWDGKDRNSVSAGSGIYILRINSGKNNKSLKLLLLR
jgi:flagellar hook assembly protein FlgD